MRTAIVTDSNSGLSLEEARALGIGLVPMPFTIDGVEYKEGINLTRDAFFEYQYADTDILTSAPSPADLMDVWDEILKNNDKLVYIPMSSGLSSSCQYAMMTAEDYDGRVLVADNKRISVTQKQSALDAKAMADNGASAEDIRDMLLKTSMDASIYIMVDTLKFLKKGGRITPAAAALGTLLKIKPVLSLQGGKLDACAKVRTTKQARQVMLDNMKKDMLDKFGDSDGSKTRLYVVHTENEAMAKEFLEEVKEVFPRAEVGIDELSLSVSCHIGKGSLALACCKKL